jgi:hypothetical protein
MPQAEGVMRAGIMAAALLAACLAAGPSQARLWKPTPVQLAVDYLTLVHNKGSEGRVTVSWVAAPAANGVVFQQLMEKYVLISIVHARTQPDGSTSWDDIQGVQVSDGNGQALKEVPPDEAAPALAGFIASASAALRQGTQGKGKVRWSIYEAGSVSACQRGRLLVTYDGETYSFDTPIPGCDKK